MHTYKRCDAEWCGLGSVARTVWGEGCAAAAQSSLKASRCPVSWHLSWVFLFHDSIPCKSWTLLVTEIHVYSERFSLCCQCFSPCCLASWPWNSKEKWKRDGDRLGSSESSWVSPPAAGVQFLLAEHCFYLSQLLYYVPKPCHFSQAKMAVCIGQQYWKLTAGSRKGLEMNIALDGKNPSGSALPSEYLFEFGFCTVYYIR